ncbi:MAG TPA: MEDS domain-containing protein [Segeticoccus sp.]|uniref:MEDS domain-containing protein n=1 Tax=Segeticoccus sp. TaxID=2706531 RepID=UPI002D7EA6DA|nr:MEDS domain-containing protein [Segeticoccus sp.]HET8601130.1 MEDS domain-containing protein [Segeticoccus sp.]
MTLALGDHACSVAGSDEARQRIATDFVRQGLRAGDRVCYLSSTASAEAFCTMLAGHDLPVEQSLEGGQLVVAGTESSDLAREQFVVEEMLQLLEQVIDESLALGYRGVRITGEMDWVARADVPASDLVDYERRATDVFATRPAAALCQYDSRLVDSDLLRQVAQVHPTLIEDPMEHATTITAEVAGLRVSGDIDLENHHLLDVALSELHQRLGGDIGECHLELADVSFIDVAGTMRLVRFAQDHPQCTLVLHWPPRCLTEVAAVLWPQQHWEVRT